MRTRRFWIYLTPVLGCIGLSAFLTYAVITATLAGADNIAFAFNRYHEAIAECVIFVVLTVGGLLGLRGIVRMKDMDKAKPKEGGSFTYIEKDAQLQGEELKRSRPNE